MKQSLSAVALLIAMVVVVARMQVIFTNAAAERPSEKIAAMEENTAGSGVPRVHLEGAADRRQGLLLLPPELEAVMKNNAFVVLDADRGTVIAGRNEDDPFPIASLTKIVSASVLVDAIPDWTQTVEIQSEDLREGEPLFHPGEKLKIHDLFTATLVRSSNTGMMALVREAGMTSQEMVERMARVVQSLGRVTMHVTDPTGLLATTVASAQDVAIILQHALLNTQIRAALSASQYQWRPVGSGAGVPAHSVVSTNQLLHTPGKSPFYTVIGGKTGYVPEGGYSLAVQAEDEQGRRVIAVILGATTFDGRFEQMKQLLDWIFETLPHPQRRT